MSEAVAAIGAAKGLSKRTSVGVLALTAGALVCAEVLFTRLLSVVTWYGLAFLVLSLAMLGLTRGSLSADAARAAGEPVGPWVSARLTEMAWRTVMALVVALAMPLEFRPDAAGLGAVVLAAAAITAPMVSGGAVVARLLAETSVALPALYAADLLSAAAGALLPLLLLGPFSAQGALCLVALLCALAGFGLAERGTNERRRALWVAAGVALLTVLTAKTPYGLKLQHLKGDARAANAPAVFERWNALSYVRVRPFENGPFALWSPSPSAPPSVYPQANAVIDGEAGTNAYAYERIEQLGALRFDATNTAHALRPDGESCVIGIGGGRDLLSALVFGHDHVTGVEINPAMVQLLDAVSDRSPVLRDPRVRVIVGDGRATLRALDVHCRVLQASMVDTWAATSAGAFAHAESTLYTREAWRTFLTRVEPDGVVTFSRWYDPARPSETSRLLALAVASLRDRGVESPREHLALVAAGRVATIVVSPEPFSEDDRANLAEHLRRYRFTGLVTPGNEAASPLLERILRATDDASLRAAGADELLDTSAPTDDRPFFFQLQSPGAVLHPVRWYRAISGGSGGVLAGNARASLELLMTFASVLAVAAFLLGPALCRAARGTSPALPGPRAAGYFACLGAGFMLAELALMQRLHVVLGHPTYALVLVLASLLVATGAGSALSSRVVRSRGAVRVVALVAGALLLALPWVALGPLARATEFSPFALRAVWCALASSLVGLLLGMLFPSGLRYVDRVRGAPVALAVNGASSVLGSVASLLVSVWAGIPASFALAGALYLVAGALAPVGWRRGADEAAPEGAAGAGENP